MRTALAATAFTALALFTAAPTALAHDDGGSSAPDPAKQAERLIRAADKFDQRAASMRTRAGRLRATALDLRLEAEELAADATGTDPAPETPELARQHDEPTPPPADDATGDDPAADPCAWDGEDDLGFSRQHEEDPKPETDGSGESEVCHLLRLADRLEARAAALDAAATRMQQHANKLREKAAKLLAQANDTTAEKLLKRAAALRTAASNLRTQADQLRETAFEGSDVDEATIAKIRRMELKAAAFDRRADRLEARAAAAAEVQ